MLVPLRLCFSELSNELIPRCAVRFGPGVFREHETVLPDHHLCGAAIDYAAVFAVKLGKLAVDFVDDLLRCLLLVMLRKCPIKVGVDDYRVGVLILLPLKPVDGVMQVPDIRNIDRHRGIDTSYLGKNVVVPIVDTMSVRLRLIDDLDANDAFYAFGLLCYEADTSCCKLEIGVVGPEVCLAGVRAGVILVVGASW